MKITKLLLAATCTMTILLSSCSVSSDVVSDRGIQKRKYRKGYFVAKPDQKPDAETAYLEPVQIDPTVKTIETEAKSSSLVTIPPAVTAVQKPISAEPTERKISHKSKSSSSEVGGNEFHKLASILKQRTPAFETAKAEKAEKPSNDQELVLFLILAILLPWLAMILLYGVGKEFLISLLLWLVFLLPGIIYAVIMVMRKLG